MQLIRCAQFNLVPAFVFVCVVCPIVTIFGTVMSDDFLYYSTHDQSDLQYFSPDKNHSQVESPRYTFRVWGTLFVILIVLFWSAYIGQFGRIFFDKYC